MVLVFCNIYICLISIPFVLSKIWPGQAYIMKNKWLWGDNSVNKQGMIMVLGFYSSPHCHLSVHQVSFKCQQQFKSYLPDKVPDRQMDVTTLHIVSYFADTDVFMNLHKPIITLFLTPKKLFYEFTNSFHAKYKPISSKCCLRRTAGGQSTTICTNMTCPSTLHGIMCREYYLHVYDLKPVEGV